MKVEITREKAATLAVCKDCNRLNPEANRNRARQHAAQSGHVVLVLAKDVTTYKPKDA